MTYYRLCNIISITLVVITALIRCKSNNQPPEYVPVDTIASDKFFITESICDFAVAKNYQPFTPQMIPWATDSTDLESESYVINGERLTIFQPLKRSDIRDSARRYFYGRSAIRTVRVVNDTLNFNFNSVVFDYDDAQEKVFQKGNFILLRNEPASWCGLANRYRFIQLFDLPKLICYEFFVDYYSCIEHGSESQ